MMLSVNHKPYVVVLPILSLIKKEKEHSAFTWGALIFPGCKAQLQCLCQSN